MTRDGSTALLGAGAGLLFVVLNAGRLGSGWSPVAEVAALIAFVGLALMLGRLGDEVVASPVAKETRKLYQGCVVGTVIVLYLGTQLLARTGHLRFELPFLVLVAGAHFAVFALVFRAPTYLSQAIMLLLVATIGFTLVDAHTEQAAAITGTLAGSALLALAVVPLLRSPRDLPER